MKKILILSVGGAITAIPTKSGEIKPAPFTKERLLKAIPKIDEFAKITIKEISSVDSVEMTPKNWMEIGKIVFEKYKSYDGIVILHGTDTLVYTAAALSLMLRNIPVPIVLTASLLPLEYFYSDALQNLKDSIQVAAEADIAEVCIVNGRNILRGNRTKLISSTDSSCYVTTLDKPLGTLDINGLHINYGRTRQEAKKLKPSFENHFNPKVKALITYPGIKSDDYKSFMESDGIVMIAYASSCIPVSGPSEFISFLKEFHKKGGLTVISNQALYGNSLLMTYTVGIIASRIGIISSFDMTYESAIVKLMWVLGKTKEYETCDYMFKCNYAGEVTSQIMDGGKDLFQ